MVKNLRLSSAEGTGDHFYSVLQWFQGSNVELEPYEELKLKEYFEYDGVFSKNESILIHNIFLESLIRVRERVGSFSENEFGS